MIEPLPALGSPRRRASGLCRTLSAALLLVALAVQSGCAAWRDVTTAPQYRLVKRPMRGANAQELHRLTNDRVSIFKTIQAMPFIEDRSARIRATQESIPHKILRFPAAVVEVAYLIVTSPLLLVSYAVALPVWYDTERDATFQMEPIYWEEYPWYWVTRGVWVMDFLFHDLPFVAVAWPIRAIGGKPYAWKPETEIDPFD